MRISINIETERMSRSIRGSKGPGWEPWSNRHERQKPAPDSGYVPTDLEYLLWEEQARAWECYIAGGCSDCQKETKMLISRDEVLMGRDTEYPLTPDLESNLSKLLASLNQFRDIYGIPMVVSSGYRPGRFNQAAGGARNSAHLTCEACDFHDPDGFLKKYILNNVTLLEQCGLYMESPASTPTWCHLQVRIIPSGNRIFIP